MIAKYLSAALLIGIATGTARAESKTVVIGQIGREAVCRNAQGAKLAPPVQPPVPASGSIEADARAHLVVGAVDCFLNPSEFTLENAAMERCSSARIGGRSQHLSGTRSISAPHCDN